MTAHTPILAGRLSAFLSLTHYAVVTDFGDPLGIGNGCDATTSFDDACDAYAQHMADGEDSAVFECNVAEGSYRDVTAAAIARIAQRPGFVWADDDLGFGGRKG